MHFHFYVVHCASFAHIHCILLWKIINFQSGKIQNKSRNMKTSGADRLSATALAANEVIPLEIFPHTWGKKF